MLGLALLSGIFALLEPDTHHRHRLRRVYSSRHPYNFDGFFVASEQLSRLPPHLLPTLLLFYRIAMRAV